MNKYSCPGQCSYKLLRFCMVCGECSSSDLQRYQELEKTSLTAGKRHSYKNALVNKKDFFNEVFHFTIKRNTGDDYAGYYQ